MKTMQYIYKCIIAVFFLLFIVAPSPAKALGMARIKVIVVDELGLPVNNAALKVRFSSDKKPEYSLSNSDGISAIISSSNDGVILGEVTKEGYYRGSFHYDFVRKKFGMWQPWNKEISVVLRPIVNPVPMYVRNKSFEIPANGKEIGFDLMKSDWVIPHGQGTHADFIFKLERAIRSYSDFDSTLTLSFSNQYNGIQMYKEDPGGDFNIGSWYRLLRTAPLDGYQRKLTINRSTSSPDFFANNVSDDNYFFRVRSEVDKEGKLKQAMYGKIRGEILVEPRSGKFGTVRMHYYLNPDYTRNLEFDPKRNLFTSLPKMEGVAQP